MENEKKRMIFHVPFPLGSNSKSASGIRPVRIYNGFKELGYEVDLVDGNAVQRKKAIKQIKENIKKGIKYDFCYSESSTQPTLHTEPYSFLKHPFFEFGFFSYLKKRGIKIGLFYRDIYWCFPEYAVSLKKRFYTYLYRYDIQMYLKYLYAVFVPSQEMLNYVPQLKQLKNFELPSGAELYLEDIDKTKSPNINLFYVGGIKSHYDLSLVLKIIREYKDISLTLCCREEEWLNSIEKYEKYLAPNIKIIHKSGEDLLPYFRNADIGVIFLKPIEYRNFAMPFKLFEFIGHGLPVLASEGTKVAKFVKENNCGFVVDYNEKSLRNFLSSLSKEKIATVKSNVIDFAPSQTWRERARTVAEILTR